MAEIIGSPDEGDATARVETVMNMALERLEEMGLEADQLINRPVGSQSVPRRQLVNEFKAMVPQPSDPTPNPFLERELDRLQDQEGGKRGFEAWMKWILDMEKG